MIMEYTLKLEVRYAKTEEDVLSTIILIAHIYNSVGKGIRICSKKRSQVLNLEDILTRIHSGDSVFMLDLKSKSSEETTLYDFSEAYVLFKQWDADLSVSRKGAENCCDNCINLMSLTIEDPEEWGYIKESHKACLVYGQSRGRFYGSSCPEFVPPDILAPSKYLRTTSELIQEFLEQYKMMHKQKISAVK